MPTWAIVTLVLGSSAISALLTFCITKMQVRHSDQRLEKELQRQREAASKQRRWEVRSVPLLKLREELAYMAAIQNEVVGAARREHDSIGDAKQQAWTRLKEAMDDWDAYRTKGNLLKSKFLQYDKELFTKVTDITENYIKAYESISKAEELEIAKVENAARDAKQVWPKVIEIQELINKRLEEL